VQLLDNNAKKMYVIMRDEIKSIEIVSNSQSFVSKSPDSIENDFDRLFETAESMQNGLIQADERLVKKRKTDLLTWLQKNHLPVKLTPNDEINILDTVYIKSPYNLNSCLSTNEIILDKVRNLIEKFDTESE